MPKLNTTPAARRLTLLSVFLVISVAACSTNQIVPLMPTPIFYQVSNIGPLDNIPEEERWLVRSVYFVTNRQRVPSIQEINYNNKISNKLSVGMALIGFGQEELSWNDLRTISTEYPREETVPLSVAGLLEAGSVTINDNGQIVQAAGSARWLVNHINSSITQNKSKDLLIYVHGAKVNFYNACAFAAQLDHFMGREMASMAFSWPTRQNILSYGLGDDVNRAYTSAAALKTVLQELAVQTEAENIHILTWSAGGRLVTTALKQLREEHNELTPEQLRRKFRIGTVYFAAADVPTDEFVEGLPSLNAISSRVVVTASSNDGALKAASTLMGGVRRIGLTDEKTVLRTEEQQQAVLNANRLEYIDMSLGSDSRGFDITGHRYWFDHPWASTDVLLAIKYKLSPADRGLMPSDNGIVWWIPEDYPQRITRLANKLESAL